MSVPLAYLGIILIWSTTPLAIKWSGQDVGFLFGIACRMGVGLFTSVIVLALWRKRLPLTREAVHAYFAIGLPLFAAMSCVYWGAQFLPSGLIAVVFGLTPLATGVLAIYWLGENNFTPPRLLGMFFGLLGLAVIFSNSFALGPSAHWGILAVLGAMFFHSLSTVWMKKVGTQIAPVVANTGGLAIATFLYASTWLVSGATWPSEVPLHSAASIAYLGVVGSVLGAGLFYYALRHLDTGKMSMLTLVTPVTALMLGRFINHETLDNGTIFGTGLVLGGLFMYQWAGPMLAFARGKKVGTVD